MKNSDRVLGLVVYTGVETKLALNLSKYRFKMSTLEKETNYAIAGNVIIMILMCIIMAFFNYRWASINKTHVYIFGENYDSEGTLALASFFSFWLILNQFIPLELPLAMEIGKFVSTSLM